MIIGLVGFAHSGKDTIGNMLQDLGFHRDSFAAPVKDAVAAIFAGWPRAMLEGATPESRAWREQPCPYWSKKFGKPFTPRTALQLMGTEIGRNIYHQNLWVDAMEFRLANCPVDYDIVITDVRFMNEMEMINRLGGVVVRIARGDRPSWYYAAQQYNAVRRIDPEAILPDELSGVHVSEYGWVGSSLIEYQINNDGSFDLLETAVKNMVKDISEAGVSQR